MNLSTSPASTGNAKIRNVAFVGLGSMGMPMVGNLVRAGYAVTGFDMRAQAVESLSAIGAIGAQSAAEAARGADALVLMVVNADQAQTVLFEAGALDALASNAVVLLMATCPPEIVASLGARVLATGRRFVDAPVSGGVEGAKAATLTIMAAGSSESLEFVDGMLRAMGSKMVRVGTQPGQGATMKAVNQLLCGVHLAAAGEAVSLARKAGLDTAAVLDIVSGSAAASWMLRDRGPRMLETEPDVTSAVDIFVKDLGIVLAAGRDAGAALPLAALAHQMFVSVSGRGFGSLDDSQIVRAFDALNGT